MAGHDTSRRTLLRLAPEKTPEPLSIDDARDAAKDAFAEARRAQVDLVSDLLLTKMIYDPSMVTYARLKGMRYQARQQLEHARAVEDALNRCIEAMEAAASRPAR